MEVLISDRPRTEGDRRDVLSPEVLAAFVDGTISADERKRVEAELVRSPAGRDELIEVSRLVAELKQQKGQLRRRPIAWFGMAAAAAAAMVIVATISDSPSGAPPVRIRSSVETERAAGAEGHSPLGLITPAENAVVNRGDVRFEWQAHQRSLYRVMLADSAGAQVWSAATSEAGQRLPDSVRLVPGARYYWYVDAQLIDGTSLTGGPREFRISR